MKPVNFTKNSYFLYYALAMGFLLAIVHWLELRFLFMTHAFEVYAGAIAVLFTALGIWLARSLTYPKKQDKTFIAHADYYLAGESERAEIGISKREMEVLQRMAKGYSNAEIATELFVSVNTVKTHVSSILNKLEVSRRTQAIDKAKRLGLLSL